MTDQYASPTWTGSAQSHHAVNPWEHDSRSITNIRNSLILAEQMGLKTMMDSSKCAQALAQLPFFKVIGLQKDVTSKRKSLFQVQQDIAHHSQEKETADLLHLDVIEKRINMVKQLCTDLDSILSNTEMIVNRLVKPFVGDHIKMNAAHHRQACEVFTMLVPSLNDLSLHLDNITWAANHDCSATQLEQLLVEVQSLTASLHTSFHTLCQMWKGMEGLSNATLDVSRDSVSTTLLYSPTNTRSSGTSSYGTTITQTLDSRGSSGNRAVK